jgi:hypothetical protein
MPITETYIEPEIFRPAKVATYTMSDIEESELSDALQDKLNADKTDITLTSSSVSLADGFTDRIYVIKNTSPTGDVVVTPVSGTIDNQSTLTLTGYESVSLVFDESNWWII